MPAARWPSIGCMEVKEPNAEIVDALREAAPAAFEGQPVLFAYLFGSHATGRADLDSDIDVGVYLEPHRDAERDLDLALRLPTNLDATGLRGIEVLVLNGLSIALRGRIVQEGVTIYSRDERARLDFESRTVREYFDFRFHARPLNEQFLLDTAEGRR